LEAAGGPLLQTYAGASRPLATMDYAQGDLLVLYTDGLVERRHEVIDAGLARLADAAQRWHGAGHSPQAIADGLLRDLLTAQRQDDVVLVVKRLVIDPVERSGRAAAPG
jgi:serine phosphatase RsbU (regulator of sigma subunit)